MMQGARGSDIGRTGRFWRAKLPRRVSDGTSHRYPTMSSRLFGYTAA